MRALNMGRGRVPWLETNARQLLTWQAYRAIKDERYAEAEFLYARQAAIFPG